MNFERKKIENSPLTILHNIYEKTIEQKLILFQKTLFLAYIPDYYQYNYYGKTVPAS